ncbi:MAG: hypothetical protein AAGA56_31550, partial [Myxococcota bacterium]
FHQWEVMPSFLLGEWLFIACALLAFVHAARQSGASRRRHLFVWFGALLAGTGNDTIFMALPLVDNFWQAQATVMLTSRMPLYIPCVYVWFMYVPTVAGWRFAARFGRLPWWGSAPLAGLAAIIVYAPYDIVGAKFLWWTWHDTDSPIGHRLLGAPIGSTMWVITFVAAFSAIVGWAVREELTPRRIAKTLPVVALASTPVMVLQVTVLQSFDEGVPGPRGLVFVVALYTALIVAGFRRRQASRWPASGLARPLWAVVAVYFVSLTLIEAAFDPATHRSLSVHQTVGPCYVEATDITGLTRFAYLCPADFDEDFSFSCAAPPPDGARWYTVCGRPHRSYGLWLAAVGGLGLLGSILYGGLLLLPAGVRSPAESSPGLRPGAA